MLVDALRVEFTAEKDNKFATRILRDADEKSRALEKKRMKMSDALAADESDPLLLMLCESQGFFMREVPSIRA